MKKFTAFLLALLCICLLTACGCKHEWADASCSAPKTCSLCGETGGEALGHEWQEATCTEPMTCLRCGDTQGEAPGHSWQEATCDTAKTCSVCSVTEGDALGHCFSDWSLMSDTASRTCTVCQAEEITDPGTCLAELLIGHWQLTELMLEGGAIYTLNRELIPSIYLDWNKGNEATFSNGKATFEGKMHYQDYQSGTDSEMYRYHFIAEDGSYLQFIYVSAEENSGLYCLIPEDNSHWILTKEANG